MGTLDYDRRMGNGEEIVRRGAISLRRRPFRTWALGLLRLAGAPGTAV
jgi:hypothetical protein